MIAAKFRLLVLSIAMCCSTFAIGACGSDDQDFAAANVQACIDLYSTLDDLECVADGTFETSKDVCQSSYEGYTTCDVSGYFDCLADAYGCVDMAGTSVLTVDQAALTDCIALLEC